MHLPAHPPGVSAFDTPFGRAQLIWARTATGPRVLRITLPGDTRAGDPQVPAAVPADPGGNEEIASLIDNITAFLDGKNIVFETRLLDLGRCRPFQQRVLLAEHAIPRGYVSTYGRIARHLGVPGGARAVGNALARNPFPIVIPCHRALRADGSPGGFQGGVAMKCRLLAMEGARFRADGTVAMDRIWY